MQLLSLADHGDELELPPSHGPAYMMLAGLAVENLAKALIVSRRSAGARRITDFT